MVGEFSIEADKQKVPVLWEKQSNLCGPGRQEERNPPCHTLPKPAALPGAVVLRWPGGPGAGTGGGASET